MKLQNMIIIFLIIVIPILLVFSVYFNGETRTLKIQREYDEVLKNATYDSILAFEKNSMSDMLSGNPENKRENIKAAINMYIKSLAGSQNLSAYNENDIKDHIPAVVFGLYDGFYMYTPTLKVDNTKYEHTLKNYVYYSEQIPNTDIVIRYSLDNYVAVSGTFDGIYMTKNGYLVTNDQTVNQEKLYENIVVEEEILNLGSDATYNYYLIPCQYKYNTDKIKIYKKVGEAKKLEIVDEKITWVEDLYNSLLEDDKWYTYSDFSVTITDTPAEDVDNSAKKYYEDALEFRSWWQENIETIEGINSALKISTTTNDPENVNSKFTNYKNKIIHQKIQSNLDTAIAAYSNRASVSSEKFKMPTLLEDDWQKIYSNISVITFLQGVDIGFTQYNSYCVLNSTNHTEYANANSLQFIDGTHNNSIYHDIRDTKTIPTTGYRSNEFIGNRLITQPIANKNYWMYYYKHLDLACYNCINDAYVPEGDILNEITSDENSKKSYYTSLAREKYVTSKSTDNFDSGGRIHIAYTLKQEDGLPIAEGQWTNQNVTLEVHPEILELTNVKVRIGTNEFEEGVAAIVEYEPVADTTFKESIKVIVSGVNNFGILEEKEINIQIKIDKEKPVINSVIKDPADWTNQNVTLTVDATDGDGQSGIDAYSFDGTWQIYNITSPLVNAKTYEENTYNIEIKVKDRAGNESLVKTENITNIDKEPPTISRVEGNPTTWTKGPVELKIIAEDTGGSGIDKYSFNDKTSWQDSNSMVYDRNTSDIKVWVKDKAGNENYPEYVGNPIEIRYIDNEMPWITVEKNTAQSNQVKVVLDINAGDNISGIKIIKTPNGDLTPANSAQARDYSTTYEITQNGTYTFEVEDNAGNKQSATINVVEIDTTPPNLNLEYNDVITRGNIPITAAASDLESGIIKIKLPDNSEVTSTGTTYTATENGTYTFTATNGVGLTTTNTATITRIDKVAPISLELSASTTAWTSGNVTITARATDNTGGSGISKITLRGGGTVEGSTGTFTVTTNGTYQFIAEDYAGNTLSNSITISNIDKNVPTLTAQYSNYIVTIKAADTGGSGINYNSLKVEGTNYTYNTTKGCWEVNIIDFSDGENTITIQDNAGNTGTLVYTRNSFNMLPKNTFVVNMQRTHFKWNMLGSDSWKATVSIPDDSVYKKLYTKYSVTYSFKELGKTEFGSDVHKGNLGMNDSFEMEYTSKNNVNADLNMTIRFYDKSNTYITQIDCVLSTSMAWYGNNDRRVWINGNLIDDNTTVFKVDLYNSGRINSDEYWFQFSEW